MPTTQESGLLDPLPGMCSRTTTSRSRSGLLKEGQRACRFLSLWCPQGRGQSL